MKLVMIDNYDSFTFNLVQLFCEFDIDVQVFRHDAVTVERIISMAPDWICISPGPRDPSHSGVSKQVVEHLGPHIPIMGVCLGMQVINEVFGGRTVRAPLPVHGKRSRVLHTGDGVFAGVPSPFWVARYHSLCVVPESDAVVPVAWAEDQVVMGIRHRSWPVHGVQFHPESFLTEHGMELVANFLRIRPGSVELNHSWRTAAERFPRYSGGPLPTCDGQMLGSCL